MENLSIGDNTNVGIITDITDTQYEVNGEDWYHKSIVELVNKESSKDPINNRGTIDPNRCISAFSNPIDPDKVNEYTKVMTGLDHPFPPIQGYPDIITRDDLDRGFKFMNGDEVVMDDVKSYVWFVTDGHHRVTTALRNDIPHLDTVIDKAYSPEHDV